MGWVWTGLEGVCFSGYQLSLIPARPLPCCLQLLCLLYFPSHPASFRPDCDWLKHCMSLSVNWSNWLTLVNTVALSGLADESCKYCYLPRRVVNALCCHITDSFLSSFQSATRVTIATASGQVKTAPDVSGWRSGEKGWHAKTWRNRKTRAAGDLWLVTEEPQRLKKMSTMRPWL